MNESFYTRCGKRAFDAFLSSLGLLILSPLFLVCLILIKFSSPGPVFFRQLRTGLEGKPF
jgi:lipopolysaccharide/colanic/teichoic acid biosynthesis glycosyltransferase